MDMEALTCSESKIEAWEYCEEGSQAPNRPHKFNPNRPVPLARLHELGVLTRKLEVNKWEENLILQRFKKERGYNYWETIIVSRESMPHDFEVKVASFFREHMHSQEETRLILDGSGYWDVRDSDGSWIRFFVKKGDLVVLPAGMFHRFTLDVDNYIEALLLYTELPGRTQHEAVSDSDARRSYINKYLKNLTPRQEISAQ